MAQFTIEQVKAILRIDSIPSAIFSKLILQQLQYGMNNDTMDAGAVIDTIRAVHDDTYVQKKGIRKFKKEPLRGFSYIHYFEARFIPQNILNHWEMTSSKSTKCVDQISRSIASTGVQKNELITEIAVAQISHDIVQGFFDRAKSNELTGEWIIYCPYKGKKLYLTLAKHVEKDEDIYDRMVRLCGEDYPELFTAKKGKEAKS